MYLKLEYAGVKKQAPMGNWPTSKVKRYVHMSERLQRPAQNSWVLFNILLSMNALNSIPIQIVGGCPDRVPYSPTSGYPKRELPCGAWGCGRRQRASVTPPKEDSRNPTPKKHHTHLYTRRPTFIDLQCMPNTKHIKQYVTSYQQQSTQIWCLREHCCYSCYCRCSCGTHIREHSSVLYLEIAKEISNWPCWCISRIMAEEATTPQTKHADRIILPSNS